MKKNFCVMLSFIILIIFAIPQFSFAEASFEKAVFIIETAPLSGYNLLAEDGISDMEIIYTYDEIFNGYAVEADISDYEEIKNLPGVLSVTLSETVSVPNLVQSESALPGGLYEIDRPEEYDGEGTVIAIIDSELDVNHDAFQLSRPENAKLKKRDIANIINNSTLNVDGITANRAYRNSKIPFAYDYAEKDSEVWDTVNVHGTHVSGIAAGNGGEIKGVAPEAQIIFMKVFRTIAGTSLGDTATVFAALNDAVKFGVSSINLSLSVENALAESSAYSTYQTMVENAKDKGIIISCSAGNSGRGYNFSPIRTTNIDYGLTGIPSGFNATTSVAASDSSRYRLYTLNLNGEEIPFSEGSGKKTFASAFISGCEFIDCGNGTTASDYAEAESKIALVNIYSPAGQASGSAAKISLAQNAGVSGIIFVSKKNYYPSIASSEIPTCVITHDNGEFLRQSDNKYITTDNILKEIAGTPKISDFSQWNYSSRLTPVVDITAPGGVIYSSLPDDEYISYSGTSMSAPYITGAAAIMDSYVSKTINSGPGRKFEPISGREKANLIENLLMSSAKPLKDENNVYYPPFAQGAGLLNIKNAISSPAILYGESGKSFVSLGDNLSDSFTVNFTKENIFGEADGYDTLNVSVVTDDYTTENGKHYVNGLKELSSAFSFTSDEEDDKISYSVSINLNSEETSQNLEIFENGFFVSGFVFLSSSEGDEPELSIPFSGFYGDFTKAPIFDKEGDVFSTSYLYTRINQNGTTKNVPLGYNMFDNKIHSSKMVVSPDGDGFNDVIFAYPAVLRYVNYLYLMLLRSEFDQVSGLTLSNIPKFSAPSLQNITTVDAKTGKIAEDGEYTVKFAATLSYKPSMTPQSIEFPITIDTQKPTILSMEKRKEADKTYLDITVKDNNSLQGMILTANDSTKEIIIPENYISGEEYTASFDISDIDESGISFEVYDYGFNCAAAEGNAFGGFIYNKNYTDGALTFDLVTDNLNREADIIAAAYTGKILDSVEIIKKAALPGTFGFCLNTENANAEIKIFIWKSIDEMLPLNN